MCWYCGSAITAGEPLGRSFRCDDCGRDLRSCRNCRFFLATSRDGCAEPRAEMTADRERGNFCDWFSLNPRYRGVTEGAGKVRANEVKARAAFDDLFS